MENITNSECTQPCQNNDSKSETESEGNENPYKLLGQGSEESEEDEFKESIQEFENLEQYSKADFSGVPEDKLNKIALHQFDQRYKEEVENSIRKPVTNEGILEGDIADIVNLMNSILQEGNTFEWDGK